MQSIEARVNNAQAKVDSLSGNNKAITVFAPPVSCFEFCIVLCVFVCVFARQVSFVLFTEISGQSDA